MPGYGVRGSCEKRGALGNSPTASGMALPRSTKSVCRSRTTSGLAKLFTEPEPVKHEPVEQARIRGTIRPPEVRIKSRLPSVILSSAMARPGMRLRAKPSHRVRLKRASCNVPESSKPLVLEGIAMLAFNCPLSLSSLNWNPRIAISPLSARPINLPEIAAGSPFLPRSRLPFKSILASQPVGDPSNSRASRAWEITPG